MSVFANIRALFTGLNKEVVSEIGKQTLKYAMKRLAEFHAGKTYRGVVYNKEGEIDCEIIIHPHSDTFAAGLGQLIKDKFEFSSGRVRIEIELIPEAGE